jgi:PhnB protein
VYEDVAEAVSWLSKVFGFSEHFRYGEPAGGAQMHLGDAWIMVVEARPGRATPAQLGQKTQSLTVFVDDVEAHHRHVKSAGARIVEELHETEYGEFQYGVEDLAGHHWLFSRHARDVNPTEWGATVAEPVAMTPQISPMLSVRNGARAIEFYKAAFGAEVLFRVDGDGGAVVAELSVGGSVFWLADESPEHLNFSPESLGGSTARMVMIVDDPDAVFQRAVAAGATVVWPVADQRYGWRVGRIVDPFGHHWEIGRPLSK